MIEIDIPGFPALRLAHLVLDFNGTLARDGLLIGGVRTRIQRVAELVTVHVVTGDTFGTARAELDALPCDVMLLASSEQDLAKGRMVEELGADQTVAIGNGRNDRQMLEMAALGIAVPPRSATACSPITSARKMPRSKAASSTKGWRE